MEGYKEIQKMENIMYLTLNGMNKSFDFNAVCEGYDKLMKQYDEVLELQKKYELYDRTRRRLKILKYNNYGNVIFLFKFKKWRKMENLIKTYSYLSDYFFNKCNDLLTIAINEGERLKKEHQRILNEMIEFKRELTVLN